MPPNTTPNGNTAARYILNVTPVEYDDAEVRIGVFPYESSEQLNALRTTHGSTHVIRREKGTEIVAVPVVAGAADVGNTFRTVRLRDELGLTAALVRNALIRHLHGLPRLVLDYRPIKFLAEGNLVQKAVPAGVTCPDWLTLCPLYEADVRVFKFDRKPPFVGVAFNAFTKRRITRTCRDLLADGFPLVGRYVGVLPPARDPRVQPRLRLVGRVERVAGDVLHLADHREGQATVAAGEAFVEATEFEAVARHVLGPRADAALAKLGELVTATRHGPARLKQAQAICKYFADTPIEVIPGLTCRCTTLLSNADAAFPPVEKTPQVVYVFDATGTKTQTWHDKGVEDYGPYSAPTFTPTRPRICVVCQQGHRGRVEQFVRKFLDGLTVPGAKRQAFVKGFVRKYGLEGATTEFFEASGPSAADYQKAVWRAISAQTDRNFRFDLALVEIEERFHNLFGGANPYLVTKAEFLSHQIPVQEFEIETAETPDWRLQSVLNNMALATYAKLGGVPWLVRSHRPMAHELVIGLGSARVGEDRLGDAERVVGITTVFSGDGNYCLSTLSQAVNFDEYRLELLSSLKATIERLAKSMNWQPREAVRLVFHAFKDFSEDEEEAVKALVASLGEYEVEYTFLHVVEDHPYLLFDQHQHGVPANDGSRGLKGIHAPDRGHYLRLSGHEVLVALVGATDLKQASDGMPRPILLRLGRGSTFKDMTYLTRQVNTFARHSWRTFFPAPLPVTILYSELIARLLGQLSALPRWNPAQMLGRIRETRWFL